MVWILACYVKRDGHEFGFCSRLFIDAAWDFGDEATDATDCFLNELTLGEHAWVPPL